MPEDNILRVGAEFDVGPIVQGTNQVVASFDSMKTRLAEFAAAADSAGKPIDAQAARILAMGLSSKETSLALGNLGMTQKQAATLTENLTDVVTGGTAALQAMQSVTKTNVAAHEENISVHKALRTEVAAMEGSTGKLIRVFEQLAAESGTLGPIIQAAFPIFAIIGFLNILGDVFEGIDKITNAMMGFGKEAQKEYAEAIAWNQKLIGFNLELADKMDAVGVVGKEGAAKYGKEVENTAAHAERLRDRQADVTRELGKLREELEKFGGSAEGLMSDSGLLGFVVDPAKREHIEEVKNSIARLTKEQEDNYLKMRSAPVALEKSKAEETARQNAEAISDAKAHSKAIEDIEQAKAARVESWARDQYNISKALDNVSFDEQRAFQQQEEKSLSESEQRKYESKIAGLERLKAATEREGRTGKNVRGELEAIDAQETVAAINLETKLNSIKNAGIAARLQLDKKESDEKERNDAALEKLSEEIRKKDLADDERLMIDKTRIAEMGVRQDEEAQLRKLKNADAVRNAGVFKDSGAEQIKAAAAAYDIEAAAIVKIINLEQVKQDKLREGGALETDQRIQQSLIAQEQEMGKLNAAWGKYDQVVTKVAVDQEKRFAEAFHKLTDTFNRSVVSWMQGSETFGQAMMKMWQGIAANAVTALLQIAEQEALGLVLHKSILETEKLDNAKAAAGGAFRSVMDSGIPFPFNVIIGAGAAAAAFATVMSFEKGGIMPAGHQMTATAIRPEEMVLPAHISKNIQGAIPSIQNFNTMMSSASPSAAGSSSSSRTMNNHISVNVAGGSGGGVDHGAIVAAVKMGIRKGSLAF